MDLAEYGKREQACTLKQRKFVHAYVKTGAGSQSILDAGFKVKNPSNMFWNLMHCKHVKEYLEVVQEMYTEETMVSVGMIVNELKNIMLLNPFETFEARTDGHGKTTFWTKDIDQLKKVGMYIKKYKIHRKTGEIEMEFYSKMDAMEMLMKHKGGYKEDNTQKAAGQGVAIYLPDNSRNVKPEEDEPNK